MPGPLLPVVRRLVGLAAATLVASVALVPGAQAAPARKAPAPYVAHVLTSESGAVFVPSRVGNPINRRGLVAGHTTVADKTRAAVFNLRTRSMWVLSAYPDESTLANDINASGEVAGERRASDGTSQAFAWTLRTGATKLLSAPGATQSTTSAINDRGSVVGSIDTPARAYAIVWNIRNGHQFTLDMDKGLGINNSGFVVGYRGVFTETTSFHTLLWSPRSGALTDLRPLSDDDSALPTDINSAGSVIGQSYSYERDDLVLHPVVWNQRTHRPCALTTALGNSLAGAINSRGQIVGVEASYATDAHRALLWNGCGARPKTLPFDPDGYAAPYGINKRGQIVGSDGEQGIAWTRGPHS